MRRTALASLLVTSLIHAARDPSSMSSTMRLGHGPWFRSAGSQFSGSQTG